MRSASGQRKFQVFSVFVLVPSSFGENWRVIHFAEKFSQKLSGKRLLLPAFLKRCLEKTAAAMLWGVLFRISVCSSGFANAVEKF
jgi:hypothetical protein